MNPLSTFLCTPTDIAPDGCEDTQPCICVTIQAVMTERAEMLAALKSAREVVEAAVAERERLVAEETEKQRVLAAEKAEQDRVAAVEAERQRVAQEAAARQAEEDRRAADTENRRWINKESVLDLQQRIQLDKPLHLEAGRSLPAGLARAVIAAIAKGEIRHVSINYAATPAAKSGALL